MIIKFDNQETQIKEKLLNYLRNEKALFKEIVFPQLIYFLAMII